MSGEHMGQDRRGVGLGLKIKTHWQSLKRDFTGLC